MASASSSSARFLFEDSRNRLAEKVQVNVNNVASVVRQIQRSSKSDELLWQCTKGFVGQEKTMENTEAMIKELKTVIDNLETYENEIEKSMTPLNDLNKEVENIFKGYKQT